MYKSLKDMIEKLADGDRNDPYRARVLITQLTKWSRPEVVVYSSKNSTKENYEHASN